MSAMPPHPDRVLVLGAGSVGASIGALLHEVGVRCALVARGAHGLAVAERGVTLQTPHDERVVRVPTHSSLAATDATPRDLVLLATMSHDTEAAVAALDSRVPIVSFQNGLAPLTLLSARGTATTLAAVVFVPAERRAPGVVALPAVPVAGSVFVGDWPRGAGAWARWLVARLAAAGLRAEVEPDIAPWARAKLLSSLGGVVVALCDEVPSDVIDAAQEEARAVWRVAREPFEDVAALMARVGPLELLPVAGRARIGGSTRAALARGDRLETASLHGSVVDDGRRLGVPTPVNERLIELAEQAVREGWHPGVMPADVLRRRMGL